LVHSKVDEGVQAIQGDDTFSLCVQLCRCRATWARNGRLKVGEGNEVIHLAYRALNLHPPFRPANRAQLFEQCDPVQPRDLGEARRCSVPALGAAAPQLHELIKMDVDLTLIEIDLEVPF
jgi:hypothetical protein